MVDPFFPPDFARAWLQSICGCALAIKIFYSHRWCMCTLINYSVAKTTLRQRRPTSFSSPSTRWRHLRRPKTSRSSVTSSTARKLPSSWWPIKRIWCASEPSHPAVSDVTMMYTHNGFVLCDLIPHALFCCMTYSFFTFFGRNVRFSRFLVHDAATANAICFFFMKDLVKPKAPFAPTFFQFYGQTAFIVKAFSTIESLWSVTFMFSDVAV